MSDSCANLPVYEGRIDPLVKNNSHTIAYEHISAYSQGRSCRILEVGCNTGYFGKFLTRDGHEIWGIEKAQGAASAAATHLNHVFCGSVENFLREHEHVEVLFDVITFGDVLEHLSDPGTVLRECRRILSPNGLVVASVPNVAHAAVRLMLLDGRWEYADRGILDRTHLRFFTKDSITDLFSEAGYAIESITPVRLRHDAVGIDVNPALWREFAPLLVDDAANVFQYVLVAHSAQEGRGVCDNSRFKRGRGPKILALPPVRSGPLATIRLANPLSAWANHFGGEVRFGWIGAASRADTAWADVIVLQRETSPQVLALIDELHRENKRIIFDIDDLLTEVLPFLGVHEHCQRMKPFLEETLRVVDAVTVTTRRLQNRLTQYQPRTLVVPNCAGPIGLRARHYLTQDKLITVIIASTDTIRMDFIVPALRRMLNDPSINVRLLAIGPPGKFLQDSGIPVIRFDNLDYEQFRRFVAGHDNSIGLLPLDHSTFSSCKSPIKFLDYAMAGIVSVCSRVPPYDDVVEDGVTGLLVDNHEEAWYLAVKALALDPWRRQQMCDKAAAFCEASQSMSVGAKAWQSAIEAVMTQPVSTDTSPLARVTRSLNDWLRVFLRPATYKSGIRVFLAEGLNGVQKRLTHLHRGRWSN